MLAVTGSEQGHSWKFCQSFTPACRPGMGDNFSELQPLSRDRVTEESTVMWWCWAEIINCGNVTVFLCLQMKIAAYPFINTIHHIKSINDQWPFMSAVTCTCGNSWALCLWMHFAHFVIVLFLHSLGMLPVYTVKRKIRLWATVMVLLQPQYAFIWAGISPCELHSLKIKYFSWSFFFFFFNLAHFASGSPVSNIPRFRM